MDKLSIDWKPHNGTVIRWYALDKSGRVAQFTNNCWGNLPRALLNVEKADVVLLHLNEYVWEESELYTEYPPYKNGDKFLDIYSSVFFSDEKTREKVKRYIEKDIASDDYMTDYKLPAARGIFLYEALWTQSIEPDKPIGYDGESKDGDYFRFLMPTIYASIEDLPQDLRKIVVVSDTVDFTKDRFFKNEMIDTYFTHMYEG